MVQRDDLMFKQVARKKQLDHLGQVDILFGGCYGLLTGSKYLLLVLSKALGRRALTVVGASMGTAMVGVIVLKKLLPFWFQAWHSLMYCHGQASKVGNET